MSKLINWIHFVLTDRNNQWDIGILMWVTYCVIFAYKALTSTPFDFQSYGIGTAGVLGGGAALQWIGKDIPPAPELKDK